jgi:pentatricopeptide repeat protein
MRREGLSPSDVVFISILKACGGIGAVDKGEQIHDEIVNRGLMDKNIALGNALVDMYAKCGAFAKAKKVLEELLVRSVVSWNAIIAGYAQEEKSDDALNSFAQMQKEGFIPNEITFTCVLKACANIGAIDKGKQIHDQVVSEGLLDKNILLGTAVVDMYAKCGALIKARKVLYELSSRNIATWNALISGYAQEGHFIEALSCFKQIQGEGLSPNEITFLCLLNACSHAGKFEEAQAYYEQMNKEYGIEATLEHHTCMVVVFGSAGHFDKAISVIKAMPSFDDPSIWVALLGACWKWGNVELGKVAFDQVIQVDDDLAAAAYVLMANIYAVADMQEDAEKVEAMREKTVPWKKLGTMGSI